MNRFLIVVAAIAVAVVLFVLLRPDDGDETTPTPTTTTGTTTTTTTTTREPSVPPPPRRPSAAVVRITVRDGAPVGGARRLTVGKGWRVNLIVTSNVSDHVHLHGYDIMRDVGPGMPAQISFRATIIGTVEAELEDRHVPLARITTQP